ncbi:MAG TPA: DNA-3-methyladenine glycosylase, partial [Bryobacteraceae bacterium]|jgi:DNA-3-methyladenine glycosylase|nr:DNA-3-methyladenine glycosylase [Bryobacteraceae bacterium]
MALRNAERVVRPQVSGPSAERLRDPWPPQQLERATEPLTLRFFTRPAVELARELIGCVLVHRSVAGMIVETEAYLGAGDLASHSARGETERTRVIFGPAGRAYVYFIYGMHECLNVVAERDGVPGCVLIRALEPLCGLAEMQQRRRWQGAPVGLANGPGKLTQALAITREHYGQRLDRGELAIRRWRKKPRFEIGVTPRIGIRECADWPLRFIWAGNSCVSKR